MVMTESTIGQRVNGSLLPQFNGKKVCIVGVVTNINPNCLTFDINTVDDVTVKVNLRKPQRDILEGYIEVHGIAQGKTIICDEIVQFSKEETEDFDAAAHDKLVRFLNTIPDLWQVE